MKEYLFGFNQSEKICLNSPNQRRFVWIQPIREHLFGFDQSEKICLDSNNQRKFVWSQPISEDLFGANQSLNNCSDLFWFTQSENIFISKCSTSPPPVPHQYINVQPLNLVMLLLCLVFLNYFWFMGIQNGFDRAPYINMYRGQQSSTRDAAVLFVHSNF